MPLASRPHSRPSTSDEDLPARQQRGRVIIPAVSEDLPHIRVRDCEVPNIIDDFRVRREELPTRSGLVF